VEKIGCGMAMANTWTDPPMVLLYAFVAFFASWVVLPALSYVCFVAYGPYGLAAGPAVIGVLYLYYQFVWLNTPAADCEEHLIFTDEACKKTWGKKKIPIHIFVSEFLDDKIRFKKDCLDTLWAHRDEFIDWRPSWNLFWFLLYQLLPSRGDTLEGYSSSSQKDVASTTKEIAEHYDRGNDFFAAFLGTPMIYTSAFYHGTDQTLEQAQENKLNMLCNKVHLKKGDKFLDIGCGWGTLVRHAAQKFGAKARGVTLSKEGAAWCRAQNDKAKLPLEQCEIWNVDYREIPTGEKFKAISAVEMAEHVGIANFQLFLKSVSNMLEDDGLFYMQVAGLRKGSNWQDTQWGLFMSRYIFPGADASTPLYWYINQLERAGFEVHSVETVGRHYSHTLHAWYDLWMKNRNKAELSAYSGRLSRLWEIFLAWSTVAAGIGSATCYQIVAHKNTYEFPRDIFCSKDTAEARRKML